MSYLDGLIPAVLVSALLLAILNYFREKYGLRRHESPNDERNLLDTETRIDLEKFTPTRDRR